MAYLDDTDAYNKELLNIMYEVLKQYWEAGSPLLVKIDNKTTKYNSPTELQNAIKKHEEKMHMKEIGCERAVYCG